MVTGLLLLMAVFAVACGGDDGHGPPPPPLPGAVTIRGNLAATALPNAEPAHTSQLADRSVEVCIEGTTVCSATNARGAFVLVAPAGGNIVLTFTRVGYSGRLMFTDIPMDAVVTVYDVECSNSTDECTPRQMEVAEP